MASADQHRELFETKFLDERRREWDIRLSVPVVHEFCRDHRLGLASLQPATLDAAQLADLAWRGTRYQARAKDAPETLAEWLEAMDGPSYLAMQEAATEAVCFFSLRTTHPPDEIPQRVAAIREMQRRAVAAATEAMEMAEAMTSGPGAPPGAHADSPASTRPERTAD
jgi:hypothetical protein